MGFKVDVDIEGLGDVEGDVTARTQRLEQRARETLEAYSCPKHGKAATNIRIVPAANGFEVHFDACCPDAEASATRLVNATIDD